MDLSLSRTRRHYIERVMERGSRREREREREREKNQRKSALLEKRDHTQQKKLSSRGMIHFLPYAYPLERMCLRTSSVAPCVKST